MEDFPVRKTIAIAQQFLVHLDALRQRIPQLCRTIFVVAPECNMGTHPVSAGCVGMPTASLRIQSPLGTHHVL